MERRDGYKMGMDVAKDAAPAQEVGQAIGPSSYEEFRIEQIERAFTYHAPTPDQVVKLRLVREAGKMLALTIALNTPDGADQTAAIRKVRDAVMTANAAIVTG